VRVRGIATVLTFIGAVLLVSLISKAQQSQVPADSVQISGSQSMVWGDQKENTVEVKGPVTITLDQTKLSADNAVIWVKPATGGLAGEQRMDIALIGNAKLEQDTIVRTEKNLLVTTTVRGAIRLSGDRLAGNDSGSDLYAQAAALRAGQTLPAKPNQPAPGPPQRRWSNSPPTRSTVPLPPPPPPVLPKQSVEFELKNFNLDHADNGDLAVVLTHGVTLRYLGAKGDLLEFSAQNVVLFTDLKNLKGMGSGAALKQYLSNHIVSAYFEGDVRVFVTPADATRNEIRMETQRMFYVFATDRAVMTDVVFHTVDVKRNIPIFMRAQTVRQLSQGEYLADNAELTTSGFATPSYALAAQKAYVRSATGPTPGNDAVSFEMQNVFIDMFGLPVFYLPVAGGTMTSRGGPLRGISTVDDSTYGFGLRTQWGLFETLGTPAPADLDAAYRLDYFSDRGFAGGLDAKYQGGFISETTKDPWNFTGDLHSYFVDDHGTDVLGASRLDEKPPDEFRGRAYIEHQSFFPDDWQLQLRAGWVSDANFLTQWFNDEYQNGLPINESIYLKHQKDSEVFTLLAEWQPNDIVTTADNTQEQREVERLPELGYYQVGQSFADDNLTFFSENTAAGLDFAESNASLAQQGFYPGGAGYAAVEPGLPSFAYTGDPGKTTYRGDFRQEVDWPINAGPFKVVPYVFGRYTVYSQGVHQLPPAPTGKTIPTNIVVGSDINRVMAGTGLRLTTAFWRVDDTVESDLFDLHRLRHVIEPEINLFTSTQTVDQSRVFIYDENTDGINDISAVQLALRQRWQTKRGGPGNWRSVDFFTLNLYGNFIGNQPAERFRDPVDFRGEFFPSLPEASLPRNSANGDALWRISDTTAVLADAAENLDVVKFATGSIGLAVQRGDRWTFFLGNRYIADLDSNITTLQTIYQMTQKYSIALTESFDFGQNKSVYYTAELIRNFDRLQMGLNVYYDQATNQSGVSFALMPIGLGRGFGSSKLQQPTQ
jgi:lipopolysaccharide assembly outer membrane protein LptD (OstA)